MVVRSLSFILGAIFLIAGISKLFALEAFAVTIGTIALVPPRSALIPAIGIVAVETLGALALFVQFRTRMVSVVFCALVAVFVLVLSSAVYQGREIVCNCFGHLGVGLTNTQELFLDIVLFNAFLILAHTSPGKGRELTLVRGRRGLRWWGVVVTMLVLCEVLAVMLVLNLGNAGTHLHAEEAIGFAERAHPPFARHDSGNRALLLMRYADLGCALCFDDFLAFADSARSQLGGSSQQVLVVFEEDQFIRNDSSGHLRRWISANGIAFPVIVAPNSLLGAMGFAKSMVLVVDRKNDVLFTERFPMGTAKRLNALQLLSQEGISRRTPSQ
jgi:uncharacterized membrane protein YphA (DoxX/SURF4 family)